MGCCTSTGKSFPSPHKIDHQSEKAVTINESRDPPPSSMEEETVKEVLSETPVPKILVPNNPMREIDVTQKPIDNKIVEEKDEIEKKVSFIPANGISELKTEVSELSSLSESLSTTTYTERIEDGEEVHQRVNRSSPVKLPKKIRPVSGEMCMKREMLPNRTPTRKPDQSPGRRNGAVGSVRSGPGMVRRSPHRRDSGDVSGRRSRSPATTPSDGGASRSILGRTPSARKFGKSPGRVAMTPMDSPPRVEESNEIEGRLTSQSESLENPLVSLECFIFL